jgi:arylsulfatase A-like enzyme
VVKEQVRLVDLMPTVLALAGAAERPPTEGRDLAPVLRGDATTAIAAPPALSELLVDQNDVRALRTAETKVISWRHAGVSYLYDLVQDPREEHPLGPASPDFARALRELDRAVAEAAAFRGAGRAEPTSIGPDLARRLGVLGYTSGDADTSSPKKH